MALYLGSCLGESPPPCQPCIDPCTITPQEFFASAIRTHLAAPYEPCSYVGSDGFTSTPVDMIRVECLGLPLESEFSLSWDYDFTPSIDIGSVTIHVSVHKVAGSPALSLEASWETSFSEPAERFESSDDSASFTSDDVVIDGALRAFRIFVQANGAYVHGGAPCGPFGEYLNYTAFTCSIGIDWA